MKVLIEFTVDIDPKAWITAHWAEDDVRPHTPAYVRRDVKQYIAEDAILQLADQGVLTDKTQDTAR